MRKVDDEKQNFEFHIIMELMNGEDMEVYLKEQGTPFMIETIREIGG